MPLLSITVSDDGALNFSAPLGAMLAKLPAAAPVVIMVHGYKYDPTCPRRDPHRSLLSARPADPRTVSWPRALGFGSGHSQEPLCIAFGWRSRGVFWTASATAERLGTPLAGLISAIARSGRQSQLIGHSLGARVCLSAMSKAPSASIGRAVLLSAAANTGHAERALFSPAGRTARVLNVTSRENDLFDALVEVMDGFSSRSLGGGLPDAPARWLDIQIDDPATIEAMRAVGYPIEAPSGRISHRSSYDRAGVFPLYRDVLSCDRGAPLARLRKALPQQRQARWSRLISAARNSGPPKISLGA